MGKTKWLLCIGGPTASGKTALALELASRCHTEIISVDSRQIFREMTIGTAKPTAEELTAIPHHFINHRSITETYDIGQFEAEALALLAERFRHCDIMIAAGGSGLYFKALLQGTDTFPAIEPAVRENLTQLFQEDGIAKLQEMLARVDPAYHRVVDIHNPARLIRALGVYQQSGKPYSSFRTGKVSERPFVSRCFYLDPPREELYCRIETRVDEMLNRGLEQEARSLWPFRDKQALQTVGYQELFNYFSGIGTLDEAIVAIKRHSRQYAKRQLTWFRNSPNWNVLVDNSQII